MCWKCGSCLEVERDSLFEVELTGVTREREGLGAGENENWDCGGLYEFVCRLSKSVTVVDNVEEGDVATGGDGGEGISIRWPLSVTTSH